MRNLNRTKNAQLDVHGPVPAGTRSGDVLPLGPDGLFGVALTDRVTQADLDNLNKTLPPGLADGEASLELVGTHLSVLLDINAAAAQWVAIYRTSAGVYTPTATGNTKIGYLLEPLAAPGTGKVALKN